MTGQKPFHESIIDLMNNYPTATNVNCFVGICKIIETTEIPKGHQEIMGTLKLLAHDSGHEFMDELLDAIRALQLGAEEAAKTSPTSP